jgi:hypothetical protein
MFIYYIPGYLYLKPFLLQLQSLKSKACKFQFQFYIMYKKSCSGSIIAVLYVCSPQLPEATSFMGIPNSMRILYNISLLTES